MLTPKVDGRKIMEDSVKFKSVRGRGNFPGFLLLVAVPGLERL